MKKIIKLSVLLLLVNSVKATTMPNKERRLTEIWKDNIIADGKGNIIQRSRDIIKDEKVLYDKIGDIDNRVVLAKKEKGMEEWRKEGNEVKLILWKNIRAQRMRAQRLAREAENRDNSNSNHGIVEEEVAEIDEEQKQECVPKRKSGLSVLSDEKEIEIIMLNDDLVALKKVAWENMGMTKDEMLRWACVCGSLEVALYLIEEGADVEARGKYGDTLLHDAVSMGESKVVELLIKNGANVEARDEYGNTLLHIAVLMQIPKVVELLIEGGADVDSRDKYGKTPLYDTLRIGDVSLVKLLIEAGADVGSKDDNGRTVIEHGLCLSALNRYLPEQEESALKVVDYLKSVVKERGGVIQEKQSWKDYLLSWM